MAADDLQLTQIPTVNVGMLVRRRPGDVYQALVDPDITTRFWFTRARRRSLLTVTTRGGAR